jgi:hypothetical protein
MLRVALAVGLFGVVHSILAADRTKRWFAQLAGERRRDSLYRPLYNGIAVVSTGALVTYAMRQKSKTLYQARGLARYAMLGAQAVAAIELTRGLAIIGIPEFLGIRPTDDSEGQGPSRRGEALHIAGPFRYSRHPLNALTIILLWLNPRMTTTVFGFNIAATLYLVLGSMHEESRLLRRYGPVYEAYRQEGPRFLL